MELSHFCDKIEQINRKMPTFPSLPVEHTYEDFLLLTLEYERLKGEISQIVFSDSDEIDEMIKKHPKWRLASVYLKAIFIFADIFINVLISESTKKRGLSLNNFIQKPCEPLLSISTNLILPAYCVVIYRNKLIAHHDLIRRPGYFVEAKDAETRLLPFTKNIGLTANDIKRLSILKNKYINSIENLQCEQNYPEILRILFHGISIGELGKINEDRLEINRIAESGGCKSMSCGEILSAVDTFANAVFNVL